jgi:mannose-6-phosphate isomerase-like protein (cupin superfamily)
MAHIGKLRTATRPTIRSAVAADGLACRIDHGLPADHVAGPGLKRPIEGLVAGVVRPTLPAQLTTGRHAVAARWGRPAGNLVRLGVGNRIPPHQNDEVDVVVVVISGRGELTLGGQVHPLGPMTLVHVPKGTVRAIAAVDGPLAYLWIHRRRSAGLQVARPAQRR